METTPYTGVPAAPAYPAPAGYPAPEYAAPEYPAPAYPAPTSDTAVPDYAPPAPVEASAPTTYPGSHSAPEAPEAPAYDAARGLPGGAGAHGHARRVPPRARARAAWPRRVPDPGRAGVPARRRGAGVSHGRASTEQSEREGDFSLADALTIMLERGASDLHLTAGATPMIRVDGVAACRSTDFPVLDAAG